MRGRVAVAGAADLAVEHRLGQLGIAMILDFAEGPGPRVAVLAGVDVEGALVLERELVVARERAPHVPETSLLRGNRAPDGVAAVAGVTGLDARNGAALVVDRGERLLLGAEARDERRHRIVAGAAELDALRLLGEVEGAEQIGEEREQPRRPRDAAADQRATGEAAAHQRNQQQHDRRNGRRQHDDPEPMHVGRRREERSESFSVHVFASRLWLNGTRSARRSRRDGCGSARGRRRVRAPG